jgi:hypothetical protein
MWHDDGEDDSETARAVFVVFGAILAADADTTDPPAPILTACSLVCPGVPVSPPPRNRDTGTLGHVKLACDVAENAG